ncbi:MAG: hypothetical protein ACXWBN_11495 [Acidimicrobiales bacterium]
MAVVVAALAVGAAACSSDSKSTKDTTTSSASGSASNRTDSGTSEADLKKAATAYVDAVLVDSASSYPYLSSSCHSKWTAAAWKDNEKQLASLVTTAINDNGQPKAGTVETRNVTPLAGEAKVKILDSTGKEISSDTGWTPWVVENGMWVTSKCDAAAAAFSGG